MGFDTRICPMIAAHKRYMLGVEEPRLWMAERLSYFVDLDSDLNNLVLDIVPFEVIELMVGDNWGLII